MDDQEVPAAVPGVEQERCREPLVLREGPGHKGHHPGQVGMGGGQGREGQGHSSASPASSYHSRKVCSCPRHLQPGMVSRLTA